MVISLLLFACARAHGAQQGLWSGAFARRAWQRRLRSAEQSCGAKATEVTVDVDPCLDGSLDAAQSRMQCESPYRQDGSWPGLGFGAGDVHAYLFTYTLFAASPGAVSSILATATSLVGVQVVHTALVFCRGAKQDAVATAFTDWCSPDGAKTDACWSNQQNANACSTAGGDCTVDLAALKALDCKELGFFEGWGIAVDNAPQFNDFDDTDPQVFYLGKVGGDAVDAAAQAAVSCGGGDFNPSTYESVAHNCHAFVETLLADLSLPAWSDSRTLPTAMTPEEPGLPTGAVGAVVTALDWVGSGGSSWPPSAACAEPTGANSSGTSTPAPSPAA